MSSLPQTRKARAGIVGGLLAVALVAQTSSAMAEPFDFDTGNAPVEVIIPQVIPVVFEAVSPTASDATIVLRFTTLITNAWFDAIAPYHPTALGVYSRIDRQAESEATQSNKNIALLHASYRILNSLLPRHAAVWDDMLQSVGLDPDDDQESATTPTGIGETARRAPHDLHQLVDRAGRLHAVDRLDQKAQRRIVRAQRRDRLPELLAAMHHLVPRSSR